MHRRWLAGRRAGGTARGDRARELAERNLRLARDQKGASRIERICDLDQGVLSLVLGERIVAGHPAVEIIQGRDCLLRCRLRSKAMNQPVGQAKAIGRPTTATPLAPQVFQRGFDRFRR